MNSTKFFPSSFSQVFLYFLISFIWIFFVVQFDLKYMNQYTLDKRMALESFLLYVGPIVLYFLINLLLKRNSKIEIKKINYIVLFKSILIVMILVIIAYTINSILIKENKIINPYEANNWMLLSIGLIAPIGEELIFRGIIQRGLNQNIKPKWAIMISALLFMFVHQPNQYPLAITAGLLFGYTYYKTNNILFPIILHIVANNFSTLISFIHYKCNIIQDHLTLVDII